MTDDKQQFKSPLAMREEQRMAEALAASTCSTDRAIAQARRERLWECLATLSEWAARRAGKEYNTDTTITMLARKVQDIIHSVDKAGWKASKQYEQNTKPSGTK